MNDLTRKSAITIELYHIVMELERRIKESHFEGHTMTLKVKFNDFTQQTRSLTRQDVIKSKKDILPLAKQLLSQINCAMKSVRLMGLSVSNTNLNDKRHEWKEGTLGL